MTMTQENYTNIGYTQGYTTTTTTLPSYQFRSTSTFTPIVGERSYISTQSYSPVANKPYRAKTWNEDAGDPEGDPVGQITEDPIGSPLILLLMAVLYLFYKKSKKIREIFAYVIKKQ